MVIDSITADAVHHFPPQLLESTFDQETVLLNLDNGVYYTLNRVGTAAWQMLKSGRTHRDVIADLGSRYHVDEAVLHRDLCSLTKKLIDEGLLRQGR